MNWRLAAAAALLCFCGERSVAVGQTNDGALPPIESVDYDAAGRFRVNGKPFFPILLYGAVHDEATLAELRDFGFNVLACRAEECEGLPSRGFYGAIHSGKVKADLANVFLGIGSDSPALYFKKNLLEQTAAANAKTIAAIPNRPIMNAIGYWEDEPAGVVAGKLPTKAVYEDLVAAIDVSAPYLYPVPYQSVASVGEATARARAAAGGKKPLLPILQLFAWDKEARYPTPAELRCMTFLALAEGATGIGFYNYTPVTGQPKGTTIAAAQPELWASVKQLNRDIAEIGPLLRHDADEVQAKLPKGVLARSSQGPDGYPKVLINSTPTKQTIQFKIPPKFSGPTDVQGRKVTRKGDEAEFTMEPFDVLILREAELIR